MYLTTINELLYYHNTLADAAGLVLLNAGRLWDDRLIGDEDYHELRIRLMGFGYGAGDEEALPFEYITNNGITYKIEYGAL